MGKPPHVSKLACYAVFHQENFMAYWIFKCNPQGYQIKDRLAGSEGRITWKATRYRDEIKSGDVAFIWLTGPDRGICAVMAVESAPRTMLEIPTEPPYHTTPENMEDWRTEGKLTYRGPRISHEQLRKEPDLENLSVFHGYQQTTNFRVTDAEGKILMRLIASHQA